MKRALSILCRVLVVGQVALAGCAFPTAEDGGSEADEIGASASALTCGAGDRRFASEIACTVDADCPGGPCGTGGCEGNRCVFCYRPTTSVCRAAAAGGCDVDEVCDGNSVTCPTDRFRPNNFVCRAAVAGGCDVQELCPGNGAACPTDRVAAAGVQCRAANGACNPADLCDGNANTCPADRPAAAGTVCRVAAAGGCDVAESCDGNALTCPADGFQPASMVCRASQGICDIADNCPGNGPTCPDAVQPTSFMCSTSRGDCDVADFCRGMAGQYTCPETRRPNNFTCRPAAAGAPCDAPENCTGTTDTCPADAVRSAAFVCRNANGGCDAPETCDGSTTACPPDVLRPPNFVCRAFNNSGCDIAAEVCSGMSNVCPADTVQPMGTVCRASAGVCDVQEVCNGTSNACPGNGFANNMTVCRPAGPDPICDPADRCPGNNANCPADNPAPAATVCRAQNGLCDIPETCGGARTCPTDSFQPMGATCGTIRGPCDAQEFCPGGSGVCPTDAVRPAGTMCRAAAGVCDVAENCNGTLPSCPTDTFASNAIQCRPAGANPTCDPAERCPGNSSACPSDSRASDGTTCDADANQCNGIDRCMTGTCRTATMSLNCDDNNPCTADSCDAVAGCRHTNVANGTGCSDGLFCTDVDTCQAGTCRGAARNCGTAVDACLVTQCDESNDQCIQVPNPAGPPCSENRNKPHMMVILDTSGTMNASTGSGMNSCTREKTRLSDAKCVLSTVVSSYGDIAFGLERFRTTASGTCTAAANACTMGAVPVTCSGCASQSRAMCGSCDPNAAAGAPGSPGNGGCPADVGSADNGEILTQITEDNQPQILRWVDYACDTCTTGAANNPELAASTNIFTPIAGSLRTAKRYFLGTEPGTTSPVDPRNPCRPYYVILITDGVETCASNADPVRAATELRTTTVMGQTFDVKTYVIGIGVRNQAERDALSGIATAGGTGMPFFADNEDQLALAFAQILEDSLLVEVCNGIDDDCDGLIDEGFTLYCNLPGGITRASLCNDPGDPCNAMDDNCARGTTDEVRNACGQCGAPPVEVCDRIDNDCDGSVDEAPADCSCTPDGEICDNMDNDCDGLIDDGLMRNCGSTVGACRAGTQTCTAGVWSPCSGTEGTTETCNGLDDDCDGVIDGIARPCGPMAVGQCQPGVELCTNGTWGTCTGSVNPSAELCDALDNDCNGMVDDGMLVGTGQSCNTVCGVGTVRCVGGTLACVATGANTTPETCNNFDDNCNGLIDEDIADMGACTNDGALCIPGVLTCRNGAFQCIGGSPPEVERCDCVDNDCDMETDEEVQCGSGQTCLAAPNCQCAAPCDANNEFQLCPEGYVCTAPNDPATGFCIRDRCSGVACPATPTGGRAKCVADAAQPMGYRCAPICETVSCGAGFTCDPRNGRCLRDDCYSFPERCAAGEFCVSNACLPDPCFTISCPRADQFCRDGMCRTSCANVTCGAGERCVDGACTTSRCATVTCDGGVCDPQTGVCFQPMSCPGGTCPENTVCDTTNGRCVRDPCLGVRCPTGQLCTQGQCILRVAFDGGPEAPGYVGAAGGGLCAAHGAAGGERGAPWIPLGGIALGALVLARRTRRSR